MFVLFSHRINLNQIWGLHPRTLVLTSYNLKIPPRPVAVPLILWYSWIVLASLFFCLRNSPGSSSWKHNVFSSMYCTYIYIYICPWKTHDGSAMSGHQSICPLSTYSFSSIIKPIWTKHGGIVRLPSSFSAIPKYFLVWSAKGHDARQHFLHFSVLCGTLVPRYHGEGKMREMVPGCHL